MLIKFVERVLEVRVRAFLPASALWIALLAAPTGVREALTSLVGDGVPFATYYPAVLLAGLLLPLGGAWSLWLASGFIAHYVFVTPRFAIGLSPAALTGLALYYASSALVVVTGAALRTAVTRLHSAREREELLNGELLHRVKNVFTLVQAVVFQASRKPEATTEGIRAEVDGWLVSMSDTVSLLARQEWQSCDLGDLVKVVLSPFSTKGQITVEGSSCEIAADGAEPLALCLHELATNAVKYGALSCPEGQVILSWRKPVLEEKACKVVWQERRGPPVTSPSRRGFGAKVLKPQRGLLDVEIEFRPDGLRCEMSVCVRNCA